MFETSGDAVFTPDHLLHVLQGLPAPRRYLVALSGGLDSTVLLHGLAALRSRLGRTGVAAVHVDHGLQPASEEWSRHCARLCDRLTVPCVTLAVRASSLPGESPEAAARRARYRSLASAMQDADMVLMAHHRNDQAETLLLQLLRGSGLRGLAAMPRCKRFGKGWLARPLLGAGREDLRLYAVAAGLQWVEDDTNFHLDIDRNYLRHAVFPVLKRRWPAVAGTFARTASHLADASHLNDALAQADLAAVAGSGANTLSVPAMLKLDQARQRNLVRFWLRGLGLPVPPAARLESFLATLAHARADRSPLAQWPGAELRRYRDRLYAMTALPAWDAAKVLEWDLREPLSLGDKMLAAVVTRGAGIRAERHGSEPVAVRFRVGGERCRPAGQRFTRDLKYLFQVYGVPPWQRSRVPLIYVDGKLAAIGDLCVCEPFAACAGEPGWLIRLVAAEEQRATVGRCGVEVGCSRDHG